jgi:hypothetical protein
LGGVKATLRTRRSKMGERTRNLEWRQRGREYAPSDVYEQTLAATTDTCVITHPIVRVDSTAGAVTTFTLPNGEPGQVLIIISDHGNDVDVVPTLSLTFSAIALDDIGDQATLFYVNDTVGWIILGLIGQANAVLYTAA